MTLKKAAIPATIQEVKTMIRHARIQVDTQENLTADQLTPKSRLERLGEPEDVAKVVEFLVTDLSDFVTGQNIKVDGRP